MAELRSRHFGERESAWVFTVTSLLVHDAAQLPFHRLESVADHFVDTPEEERVYADRIAEQAAYFGITPNAAIQIGREASGFTKQALTKPFTIHTRWRPALGRSMLPRYYAIVLTADGHDLNELLVSAGLARIYGTRTPLPDGRDSRTFGAPSRARNAGESGAAWRVEQGAAVKYWEIIADNLSRAGWSWGCVSTLDSRGRTIWMAVLLAPSTFGR